MINQDWPEKITVSVHEDGTGMRRLDGMGSVPYNHISEGVPCEYTRSDLVDALLKKEVHSSQLRAAESLSENLRLSAECDALRAENERLRAQTVWRPMSSTTVVNKYRDSFDVYIGRGSIFGNPFKIGRDGDRHQVIELYQTYFLDRIERDIEFRNSVLALRGKTLVCFCKPEECHGDVIIKWLEENKDSKDA